MYFKSLIILFFALVSVFACADNNPVLEKPTPEEAKRAFMALMQLPEDIQKEASVVLGTCVPAIKATHKGQIACTILLKMGAGSSQTQGDFYKDPSQSGRWVNQPSESQALLPFPDPKLH